MVVAYVCAKSLQLHLTQCDPLDCSPPCFSIQGVLQARILERIAMPSSRGSSQPRDGTRGSYASCIGRWVLFQFLPGKPRPTWDTVFFVLINYMIHISFCCYFPWTLKWLNYIHTARILYTLCSTSPEKESSFLCPNKYILVASPDQRGKSFKSLVREQSRHMLWSFPGNPLGASPASAFPWWPFQQEQKLTPNLMHFYDQNWNKSGKCLSFFPTGSWL